MDKIVILVDDLNQSLGGSTFIEKQLVKGFMVRYPNEVKIIYKKHDWNYIDSSLDELKGEKVRLVFDLSYWPVSYHQIKFLTNNLKVNGLDLLLGEGLYYARRLKVKSALLLQAMGLHKNKWGIPSNLLNYLKVKKNFPIDIFFKY